MPTPKTYTKPIKTPYYNFLGDVEFAEREVNKEYHRMFGKKGFYNFHLIAYQQGHHNLLHIFQTFGIKKSKQWIKHTTKTIKIEQKIRKLRDKKLQLADTNPLKAI